MDRWQKWFRIALAVYWVCLFIAQHIPASKIPPTHVSDKLIHVVMYSMLGVLLWMAIGDSVSSIRSKALLVLGIVMVYGAIDEWTQPLVGRSCSLDDWVADTAGGVIAIAVMAGLSLWYQRRFAAAGVAPRDFT